MLIESKKEITNERMNEIMAFQSPDAIAPNQLLSKGPTNTVTYPTRGQRSSVTSYATSTNCRAPIDTLSTGRC